jgi:cobalt-zinc-cadmium efflux system protein
VAHEHPHQRSRGESRRALIVVLALTATFTVAEVVGGLLTGSLALLADAGHMLSDNLSLGLALFAAWLAGRPATPERSFGYQRAEILAALFNGVTLVAISIWIFIEAYSRLREPPEVLGGWMLAVAALGLLVNAAGALILSRSEGENLNVQGALRHVIADALGSVGAIVAALVIVLTGWRYADPLVSVAIGLLILASSWSLLRDSTNILLEATPRSIDAEEVGRRMAGAEGVVEVHDLHIWTITSGFPALSAHVLVGQSEDCHARRRDLEDLLAREYGISHTTLQVDHVGDHEGEVHGPQFLPLGKKHRHTH